MALTKCKECDKEVSTGAKSCPHCGIAHPGVKHNKILNALVIIVIIVAAVSMCSTSKSTEPPKTIQEISRSISAVQNEKGVLRITLAGGSVLNTKDVMQNTSMDSHRIAEKLVRYFPAELDKQVVFIANAEMVDQFGKQSTGPVFELQFKADDLKKVNFDTLYHWNLLDLAAPVKYLSIAGADAVVAWCNDGSNRTDAKKFCATNAR